MTFDGHADVPWGHAILAAIPDLVFLIDRDGRYIDILAESDDGLLLPRDELIGKTIGEVLPPAVAADCMAVVRSLTLEGNTKLFHYEVSTDEREQIDECLCTVMFNAVRELLLNVVKHADIGAAAVDMSCAESAGLRIVVSDGGRGFDPASITAGEGDTGGFGLFAIRERLESLGGQLRVESAPGRGSRFTLSARVPSATPFAGDDTGSRQSTQPTSLPMHTPATDAYRIEKS